MVFAYTSEKLFHTPQHFQLISNLDGESILVKQWIFGAVLEHKVVKIREC